MSGDDRNRDRERQHAGDGGGQSRDLLQWAVGRTPVMAAAVT